MANNIPDLARLLREGRCNDHFDVRLGKSKTVAQAAADALDQADGIIADYQRSSLRMREALKSVRSCREAWEELGDALRAEIASLV